LPPSGDKHDFPELEKYLGVVKMGLASRGNKQLFTAHGTIEAVLGRGTKIQSAVIPPGKFRAQNLGDTAFSPKFNFVKSKIARLWQRKKAYSFTYLCWSVQNCNPFEFAPHPV
jgi:hypothetical protein